MLKAPGASSLKIQMGAPKPLGLDSMLVMGQYSAPITIDCRFTLAPYKSTFHIGFCTGFPSDDMLIESLRFCDA